MGALTGAMRGYGAASAALIAVYPLLPAVVRPVVFFSVCVPAIVALVYGRRRVPAGQRRPWTLLAWGIGLILSAAAVAAYPSRWATDVQLVVDAAGYVLVFAAALAFILRRGPNDLGGIVDTSIASLAAGGLLWGVAIPHRQGFDDSALAQLNLFVAIYALTGISGALWRLSAMVGGPGVAVWLLMGALGLALAANVTRAFTDAGQGLPLTTEVLFMAAFVMVGLFGLDPDAPRLARRGSRPVPERLTLTRLVLLGIAVAVLPVVIGVRELANGSVDGLLLAVQGALVATLVMVRIGLLASQRAQAEQALQHQATHDPLTQLPNRREFVDRLTAELNRGHRCLLLFCDLDGFKLINDRFGHDTGDEVLIEVARRLVESTGPRDVVSRFGGDEFVILLVDATPAEGEAVANRISEQLARPLRQAAGLTVGASIGLSYTDDSRDPEDLIRSADRAMYRVKATHTTTR